MFSLFAGLLASTFDFGSPIASDELSRRCAAVLAWHANRRGLTTAVSGATVSLSTGEVTLRARVEARQKGDGRMVVSVAVESSIDGQPGVTVGSVGVGRNEAEAIETAVQEWGALVAPAVLGAVVTDRSDSERYVVDGYVAYPGATGFRGASPAWRAPEHQRLLTSLRRALPVPVPGRLRALTLTVMVEAGQPPQGEVRFDGVVAPMLWSTVQMFEWPPAKTGYIFKQFYMLAPEGQPPTA